METENMSIATRIVMMINFESVGDVIARKSLQLKPVLNFSVRHYLQKRLFGFNFNQHSLLESVRKGETNSECYSGSLTSILGMKANDILVRGELKSNERNDFEHGWIEFKFLKKWYIFDTTFGNIYLREDYYELFEPLIDTKITKAQIMKQYFNDQFAEIKTTLFGVKHLKFRHLINNSDEYKITNFLRGEARVFHSNVKFSCRVYLNG